MEPQFKIGCPACGTQYTVPESAGGKRVRCKKCNEAFVVALPSVPPEREPAEHAFAFTSGPAAPKAKKKPSLLGNKTFVLAACLLGLFVVSGFVVGLFWLMAGKNPLVNDQTFGKLKLA
jgi:predicted Zn finger-like uncharacterized protein